MAAMTVLLAPLSGRIVAARGPRLPLILAGIATTAGGIMLTRITRDSSLGYLFASYVVFGTGGGLVNAPITNTAVSGMPRSQAGVAAGIASTSRQVGTTLGVAVGGSAVLSALHGSLRLGFVDASRVGWWIIAGCGVAILLIGLATSGRWARGTAERTAATLMPSSPRVPVSTPSP
jgi:Major Facilitator Superfamily